MCDSPEFTHDNGFGTEFLTWLSQDSKVDQNTALYSESDCQTWWCTHIDTNVSYTFLSQL